MIFGRIGRHLTVEFGLAWLAVTLVLMFVLITNRLVRFLGDAVSGDVPANAIFSLLGLKALGGLGTLLPASFFLGVMLALGRLYRDSEMTAMAACGIGPGRIYRAIYALAVPLAIVVALLSLYIMPWSERAAERTLLEARQQAQFQGVTPGRFLTFLDGRLTVYVGALDDAGAMRDVFGFIDAPADGQGRSSVVTAGRARRLYAQDSGDQYLALRDGVRHDLPSPAQPGWRTMAFDEYGVRLDRPPATDRHRSRDEMSSTELWGDAGGDAQAELQWRLSMPLVTLVLAFIALPLARSTPRAGRYAKLVGAVLIYMAYFSLLKAAQEWMESGAWPTWLGLWWIHGLFLSAGVLLLGWRLRVFARPRSVV